MRGGCSRSKKSCRIALASLPLSLCMLRSQKLVIENELSLSSSLSYNSGNSLINVPPSVFSEGTYRSGTTTSTTVTTRSVSSAAQSSPTCPSPSLSFHLDSILTHSQTTPCRTILVTYCTILHSPKLHFVHPSLTRSRPSAPQFSFQSSRSD